MKTKIKELYEKIKPIIIKHFKNLPKYGLYLLKLPFITIKNIFIPDKLSLKDGEIVTPPKPIIPYVIIALIIVTNVAVKFTNFSIPVLIERLQDPLGPIAYIKRFFPIDWAYYSKVVDPIVETIQMSLLGSFLGVVLALPAAFLASSNLIKNKVLLTTTRVFLSIFRTLPILIYAALFKLILGPGAFTGTMAIMLFTFSIVAKMLFEKIETIDLGAYEAIQSTGASRIQAFATAVFPEIAPSYYSIGLYAFEINIRYAAILGYVGAGGIGFTLDNVMKVINQNDRILVVVLFIFAAVIIIENLSRFIRRRLA